MAAVATGAEGGADGWSGMLTDAVVKCGRDSDRRLYMYGISSNRCPKCQARLRSDSNTCGSCHYTHKTPRQCTRCSKKNRPAMWCAECDAYFCASCHKKPHVLMLGSSKPHHCFAIDGASGKQFVEAAWADEFTAMVQATYRLRLHDKMLEEAAAKAPKPPRTEATASQQQQNAAATASGDGNQSAPASSTPTQIQRQVQRSTEGASSSAGPPTTSAAVNGAAGVSALTAPPAAAVTGQSSLSTAPHAQEQTRKRQLPGPDDTRDRIQKSIRPENSSGSVGGAATTPSDGMSLYDRVKAMHDMRAKSSKAKPPQAPAPKMSLHQLLSKQQEDRQRLQQEQEERGKRQADHILQQQREQCRQKKQERAEQLRKEQEQLERERAEHLRNEQQRLQRERAERLRVEQQQQEQQQQQQRLEEKRRQEAERQRQDELRRQDEQRRQGHIQEQLRQQRLLEERVRHEQILRRQQVQVDAQSLVREGNRYISQAQHVLQTQPGHAAASMGLGPPNISVPMQQTPSTRITRVPSPISVSPHAQRFQPVSTPPSTQTYPYQPAPDLPVSNGYSPMGNEHRTQVFNTGPPVVESRFETISHEQAGNHHLVVRDPNVQHQQNEQHQAELSDAMVSHRMTTAAANFSLSKTDEDDELRAIWVSDYDNVNALIMQLDSEISKRTEEGHAYVHRSNNITIPEQLKLQINNLRAQRDQAMTKRFESVVRVLIFSEAVRSFAQQNEHTNIWSDVPEVLKASHKKCAELSADIREFERQAQKLREGIDDAVSSGNPAQMQNVAQLGALIADVERKTHVSNAERDKQFIFMFQFSDKLRSMVRGEWAKPARSYN